MNQFGWSAAYIAGRHMFRKYLSLANVLLMLAALPLLISGCSEQQSTTVSSESKSSAPEWKQHYEQAWTLFTEKKYGPMVQILESTKQNAKAEAGAGSQEWGNYLTRLARAHYFNGEAATAAPYAEEAVSVLDKVKAPSSNRFGANWFAGVSRAKNHDYDKAIPYLRKAITLSHETDPGDGLKNLYEELVACYRSKKDAKQVLAVQKEMSQRLAHK
jgi:tetratricopeptide (TPR) repeat protein